MDVAYVTMQFPHPSETFATNEVRMLSERGAAIAVHGLRREHPTAPRLKVERGLPTIRTTHNGMVPTLRGILAALRRPVLLARCLAWITRSNQGRSRELGISLLLVPRAFDVLADIERQQPQVVHMYWGHYPTIVGYLVQRRLPSTVTSVSIVAYDLEREYGGAIDVVRHADVIRTHAVVNRAHVVRFTGVDADRVNVIFNGVDLPALDRIAKTKEKVRHRIVTAARLREKKGVSDVLHAFAIVHRRWPDASLVVLGDGPERATLEQLARKLGVMEAVDFRGHVAHHSAIEEMAQAEVFMLLSRAIDERLPNVVKEGMATGCVCITTPTPGIEELVDSGANGFVVPFSDAAAAANVIDEVFSARTDVIGIRMRAVAHIREHFALTKTAPRYAVLWREAIEAKAVRDTQSVDEPTV